MRWLLDEMLPPAAADQLNRLGHDAASVYDLGLAAAADEEVFERAITDGRVVVTENFAHYAAILERRFGTNEPSTPVVFIRKSAFPRGAALAGRLAARLHEWASNNPRPYAGAHWP